MNRNQNQNQIAIRAQRDVRKYSADQGLDSYATHSELTIDITCGANAGTARLFGSHDVAVPDDNDTAGIEVSPVGSINHEYVRSFLKSKGLRVQGVELSASSAAQLKSPWTFIKKDIIGQEQTTPINFRANSMQVQDTKLENPNLALLIDGETEIRIPMLANSTMSVTFIVVGYTN